MDHDQPSESVLVGYGPFQTFQVVKNGPQFRLHTKLVIRQGDDLWLSGILAGEPDLATLDHSTLDLTPIPRGQCYPKTMEEFTKASVPLKNKFIKRLRLQQYDSYGGSKWMELAVHEAKVYEILARDPHPNIGRYYGCVVDQDDRITGLVLEKTTPFADKLVGASNWVRGEHYKMIKSGLEHLHQLNLVHNKLTSGNIRIDSHGLPVITNFESCTFVDEENEIAATTTHDLESLKALQGFIMGHGQD
ncbi:hypothetical protein ACHAPT_011025 [Fusarium lateritium]